jgi:type II secretory pathway pseudopilin PulG
VANKTTQAGETLIETLIAVILLGLLGVGVVAAMTSIISVSDYDAKQSGAETVLRSYAQAWNRAPYVACTGGSPANPYGSTTPPGFTLPSGYTASVSGVTFWNGTSSTPVTFGGTCPASGDAGLQSLSLRVTSPRGPAQTLTIQKRSP